MLLRALVAVASVGGTAGALTPLVLADRDAEPASASGAKAASGAEPAAGATASENPQRVHGAFDEMYRGRHIQGGLLVTGRRGGTERTTVEITIDGRPLHVMRRADGSFMSALHHFESFATPLAAARAAVDELGSAQLA